MYCRTAVRIKGEYVESSDSFERMTRVLEEMRDNQRLQLERQAEALTLQKEQFQLFLKQHERTLALQDRAEALQAKSSAMVDAGRKLFAVVIPVLAVLLLYAGWLLLRRVSGYCPL
jgi:hypothetical protein